MSLFSAKVKISSEGREPGRAFSEQAESKRRKDRAELGGHACSPVARFTNHTIHGTASSNTTKKGRGKKLERCCIISYINMKESTDNK